MTVRLWSALIAGALFTTLLVLFGGGHVVHLRETSGSTYYCSGWSGCNEAGYSDAGYGAVSNKSYWRMYAGHNCVNYVAYRMVKSGMPNTRPWSGSGNAANWGHALSGKVDQTPTVGAVAWWDAYHHVGSAGHVAYVEKVNSPTDIVISEDSWSGTFHWQHLTKDGGFWPSGFIHINDVATGPVLANKVKPFIEGTPKVGSPLVGHVGTWTGKPTSYSYAWFANGVQVPGATSSTFTPTAAQLKKSIGLRVTGSAPKATSVTVSSGVTDHVVKGTFTNTDLPAVNGDPIVGQTLTADTGDWAPDPASYTYNWRADGQPIDGATGSSLPLTADLVGKRIAVIAHARAAGFKTGTRTSPATPVYAGRMSVATPFTISGATRLGSTLTAHGAFAPADASTHYQWLRAGVPIPGATQPTYVLQAGDLGKKVSVHVTGDKPQYIGAESTAAEPDTVRTPSKVELRSVGTQGGAVVHVHVTAPGIQHVSGMLLVRVAGVRRKVALTNGAARIDLTKLPAGHQTVRVYYLRNQYVFESNRSGGVTVR